MKRVVALLGLAIVLTGRGAEANGRYPLANQLVVGPRDASHIAIRTTFGLVLSSDRGRTWSWVCEQAAGFVNGEDPAIELTEDDSIFVASSSMFATSHDFGCSWSPALAADQVIDADVDRGLPKRALAVVSLFLNGDYSFGLQQSMDDGATWSPLGVPFVGYAFTVALGPAPPSRIYVSSTSLASHAAAVNRSDDEGQTWQKFLLPSANDPVPFLAAVDPINPDRVYVRATTSTSRDVLFVSQDGGANWTQVLEAAGALAGFALSPDGQKVAVGGPLDPLRVASTADFQFQQVNDIKVSCLTWGTDGLYACADAGLTGFGVGVSIDDGATFAPLFRPNELSVRQCSPTTATGQYCPLAFRALMQVLGDAGGVRDASAPEGPGGPDAAGDSSEPHGVGDAPSAQGSSSGCRLAAPLDRRSHLEWIAMAAFLGWWVRRHRSRSRPVAAQ